MTRDPWHILSSEVMLQQTQALRVVEPFERWIRQFPDPAACARAGPAAAVRAWDGLGYNRRALNLQRAAVVICDRHSGQVPSSLEELENLPGVGPYTARAVMVFAFERDVGVVDTNVARVLCRAVAGRRPGPKELQSLADSLVPPGRSWPYNQTLFDVGALYCRARNPVCDECPLASSCAWLRMGRDHPDPFGSVRAQTRFAGSDRQGRGRLVATLRRGSVGGDELAVAAGWPNDARRALAVAGDLVREGLAVWGDDGRLTLP